MLTQEFKNTKLVVVILLSVLLTNNIFARPLCTLAEEIKSGFSGKAIESLAIGIESDNAGLKKSCIYLAGFYEIEEAVGTLVKQLKKEPDADTRILIALSLYKIGNKEALKAIEELAKSDVDLKVQRISSAILNQFVFDSSKPGNLGSLGE